jgi:hypothetical protein
LRICARKEERRRRRRRRRRRTGVGVGVGVVINYYLMSKTPLLEVIFRRRRRDKNPLFLTKEIQLTRLKTTQQRERKKSNALFLRATNTLYTE